jgi:hypothetical protein
MKSLVLILKQLFIWILPFIGLGFYLSAYYNMSVIELAVWWGENYSFSVTYSITLIAFTILFLLFSLQFSSLMNSLYLGLFGRKYSQVFLGYLAKSAAMYYQVNDKTKTVFSDHDYDEEFNYSFNDINRLRSYIRLPFTKDSKVNRKKHLHPYSILTRCMLSLFLLMPLLAAIHALALPAYNPEQVSGVVLTGSAMASFDQVLSYLNLNIFYLAVIFFLSLTLAMYFSNRQTQEDKGKLINPLPENISPNNIVTGKPLIITKTTIEKYDDNTQSNTHVDTGFRRVPFEFSKEFNPPVFVTLKFDGKQYPELEEQIKSDIKSGSTMDLQLTGKLRLQVIEEEEETEEKST